MAQVLSLVDSFFIERGCEEAQSAIVAIIDGKPPLEFQTRGGVCKASPRIQAPPSPWHLKSCANAAGGATEIR